MPSSTRRWSACVAEAQAFKGIGTDHLALVLAGHFAPGEFHGAPRDVAPLVLHVDGDELVLDHRVGCSGNIEVGLELQRVVVHRPAEGVMDLVPVVGVVGVVGRLDVPGCSDNRLDRPVQIEDVVESIVVAATCEQDSLTEMTRG